MPVVYVVYQLQQDRIAPEILGAYTDKDRAQKFVVALTQVAPENTYGIGACKVYHGC